jgi:SAM-dependent methyltransferase
MPAGSGDGWPVDYERGRPGWPPEVVEIAAVPASATVLDLGAGTGKLTRLLVSAFDSVIAVEPADAMRRLLARHCPEAEALAGTGQKLPLPDTSVDAVFAAEAFHSFHDDRALEQVARVLKPGGAVVLMWNLPAGPTEPSIAAVEELLIQRVPNVRLSYDPLDLGAEVYTSGRWHRAIEHAPFEPLRSARLENRQTLDPEGVVAFFASMGWIANLPDDQRLQLLDEVRSLLAAAEYQRMWETHLYWTRLVSD